MSASNVYAITGGPLHLDAAPKSPKYQSRFYSEVEQNMDLNRKRYDWGKRDSGSRRALASLQLLAQSGKLDALVAAGLDHEGRLHIYMTGEAHDNRLLANGMVTVLAQHVGGLVMEAVE